MTVVSFLIRLIVVRRRTRGAALQVGHARRRCRSWRHVDRDSSLRLNLGRDVTSTRCGSFWSTAVLRAFPLLPHSASVAVVHSPKFNLDMIVHSFTSRFSKTYVQHPDTCVLPHFDWVSQRMWSTMPTTCRFGLQTTPMSEIPYVVDCAAYRLLSKRRPFQVQQNCTIKMIAKYH